jgi:type IV secretory pathway VirB10-like protein
MIKFTDFLLLVVLALVLYFGVIEPRNNPAPAPVVIQQPAPAVQEPQYAPLPVNVMQTPVIAVIGPPTAQATSTPVEAPDKPALPIDLTTCVDMVVYSAPVADASRTVAIIPAGSTMPIEARSPDMGWVKVNAPGAATEWWMPASAFCFE